MYKVLSSWQGLQIQKLHGVGRIHHRHVPLKFFALHGIGLMYQHEILQESRDCYLLLEDHQLYLIRFKAGYIKEGLSYKIT